MLKYIDDVVETELEREYQGDRGLTVPAPVRLHGFAVPAEVQVPQHQAGELTHKRQAIDGYRKRAADLRVKLMERGITPLAVLPREAWHRLCDEYELFRLYPDAHGKQSFNADVVTRLRVVPAIVTLGKFCTIIGATLLAALTSWLALGFFGVFERDPMNPWLIGVIGAALFTAVAATITVNETVDSRVFRRNVDRYFATRTWPEILRDVLYPEYQYSHFNRLELRLPDPPKEVAEIIVALRGLTPYVAAEAAAIEITNLRDVFNSERLSQIEAERMPRGGDPIIYVEQRYDGDVPRGNDAVAIIAQYGDFPMEKEVIDCVVAGKIV